MKAPDSTEPTQAVASWLAGHAQAMGGGDRVPAPSIEDVGSWYQGYDVGTRDKEEEDYSPTSTS